MPEVRLSVPPLRSASTVLAIAVVATSVVWSVAHERGVSLYLRPASVLEGEVWQLATWMWAAAPATVAVLFSALVLWLTGASLEARWGRRRFLRFALVVTATTGLLTVAVAAMFPRLSVQSFFGAHVMSAVVWVGYGCSIWRGQTNVFGIPVSGKGMALFGVGVTALNGIFSGIATVLPEAIALAMTFAYALYGWPSELWRRLRDRQFDRQLKRRAAHLRSVEGGRRGPPDDFIN